MTRLQRVAAGAWTALLLWAPCSAATAAPAAPLPSTTTGAAPSGSAAPTLVVPSVPADEPWWRRAGFSGQRVDALRRGTGVLEAHVDGAWGPVPVGGIAVTVPPAPTPPALAENVGSSGPPLQPGRFAAPAGLPGVVVAADPGGALWRRGADGDWRRAFLFLPVDLLHGPPRVTAVTAFTVAPVSDAVWVSTDGDGVLESTDGGDTWVRGGPGLPDSVLTVRADEATAAVYAGTADGLWVHRLRALPAPPKYVADDLTSRIAGTAVVTALSASAGIALLLVAARRREGQPTG